jgi:thiol-disulfide isomerase/thioredoxin
MARTGCDRRGRLVRPIAALSVILSFGCSRDAADVDQANRARSIISVAIAEQSLVDGAPPAPAPPAPSPDRRKCENCHGTGIVGDGVIKIACKVCNGTGWIGGSPADCGKPQPWEKVSQGPPAAHVLFFSASWCAPCQKIKREVFPWLAASGWKIGEADDCHVQIIDADKSPDVVQRFGIDSLPAFVAVDRAGRELRRSAFVDKWTIPQLLNGAGKATND